MVSETVYYEQHGVRVTSSEILIGTVGHPLRSDMRVAVERRGQLLPRWLIAVYAMALTTLSCTYWIEPSGRRLIVYCAVCVVCGYLSGSVWNAAAKDRVSLSLTGRDHLLLMTFPDQYVEIHAGDPHVIGGISRAIQRALAELRR
ncbi:hypothetical protein [Actinoplanes sp. NBRC 103695]|uniref:hypothetical protein n=1 Tax=Actinoplanes sp. NBRC 103695 TaxID=3032202 RepID=UPI0024A56544|nr:hypothetical protein [Actinoplanes sp. NBRC 103695]GLZ01256.1 hypothetical protein Acsp02_85070 [Actinoplanes sp. NBRC 103695]